MEEHSRIFNDWIEKQSKIIEEGKKRKKLLIGKLMDNY